MPIVSDAQGSIALIGDIVKNGLEAEGPDYATSPCGRFWLELVGVIPEAVHRKATALDEATYLRLAVDLGILRVELEHLLYGDDPETDVVEAILSIGNRKTQILKYINRGRHSRCNRRCKEQE